MKLIALNEQWAIYSPEGGMSDLDEFSSLQDLLAIKTYPQLIKFLMERTLNDSFLVSADTDFADSYDRTKRIWCENAQSISLQGNLSKAIDHYPSIDYLDKLVTDDLRGKEVYQLDLTEIADYQKLMRKFLTVAAIALGSDAPEGLFIDIPSEDILDKQWIEDVLHCKPDEIKTIGLSEEAAGFMRHGLLRDDMLESAGIFNQLDKYSSHQLVIDDSQQYGAYTDGYPFSTDKVIYTYSEYNPPTEEENERYSGEYYVTVSFLPDTTPERAMMMPAGHVVESALNSYLDFGDQFQFTVPYYSDEDFDRYKYVPDRGFVEKKVVTPAWWVDDLYSEATKLIIEGKVSLCPVCGSPVLIKDFRGRKSKLVCSDSCKTKASNQRRETAYQCAASGIPVEEAITRIGEEYERSVRKWYAEAQAFIAQ